MVELQEDPPEVELPEDLPEEDLPRLLQDPLSPAHQLLLPRPLLLTEWDSEYPRLLQEVETNAQLVARPSIPPKKFALALLHGTRLA